MLIRNNFISPGDGSLSMVPPLEVAQSLARCLRCGRNRDVWSSPFNAQIQRQLMNELHCLTTVLRSCKSLLPENNGHALIALLWSNKCLIPFASYGGSYVVN